MSGGGRCRSRNEVPGTSSSPERLVPALQSGVFGRWPARSDGRTQWFWGRDEWIPGQIHWLCVKPHCIRRLNEVVLAIGETLQSPKQGHPGIGEALQSSERPIWMVGEGLQMVGEGVLMIGTPSPETKRGSPTSGIGRFDERNALSSGQVSRPGPVCRGRSWRRNWGGQACSQLRAGGTSGISMEREGAK